MSDWESGAAMSDFSIELGRGVSQRGTALSRPAATATKPDAPAHYLFPDGPPRPPPVSLFVRQQATVMAIWTRRAPIGSLRV